MQTSTEIFNHTSSTAAGADARELLVRVIFVQDPETNDKIIKATNSQTPIPSASLRATDKIHRDIEDYLRPYGLSYDRRKNQYRNRGISPAKIVSIPLMAQAIMSTCLGRPNDARARPSSLLKKDGDYQEIFNPQYPINVFLIAARIIKCVQDHLNGRDDIVRKDRNNIQFHASAVVSSLLTGKRQPTASDLSRFDVESISDELVTRGVSVAHSVYVELGSTDQIAKSHDFVRILGEAISSQLVS